MQFGLIGAGGMGRYQAHALAAVSGARLVAIAEPEPSPAARQTAERHGADLLPGAEALLARADVEAVIIATPTPTHAPLAIAAARAGKHVFCEKPIARTLPEAEAMIAAAERAGVRLAVGHVVRYFPDYATARDLVLRGELGTPGVARALRLTGAPRGVGGWFGDVAASGGVILDVMIHDFDWMRWTFGPVERVHALGLAFGDHGGRDAAMATLRFRAGALGYVEGSWCARQFRTALEISGSDGLIQTNNQATATQAYEAELPPDVALAWHDGLEHGPYVTQLREVADWFAGGPPPRHTAEDAREALRIALAALECVRTGRPMTLAQA